MFEIIDATGAIVTTTDTRPEAIRAVTRLEFCTLQAHRIRAAASVYDTVVWIGDIPVRV